MYKYSNVQNALPWIVGCDGAVNLYSKWSFANSESSMMFVVVIMFGVCNVPLPKYYFFSYNPWQVSTLRIYFL